MLQTLAFQSRSLHFCPTVMQEVDPCPFVVRDGSEIDLPMARLSPSILTLQLAWHRLETVSLWISNWHSLRVDLECGSEHCELPNCPLWGIMGQWQLIDVFTLYGSQQMVGAKVYKMLKAMGIHSFLSLTRGTKPQATSLQKFSEGQICQLLLCSNHCYFDLLFYPDNIMPNQS